MNDAPKRGWENGRETWFREAEILVLLVLVFAAYFVRLGDLSMRGEEPRRAQVAFEILQRGDWIVPREQGEPFLSRPPLQNWVLALSSIVFGTRDAWAMRLPSVLAMLLTSFLIYGYSRICLSRIGALAAAVAFVTFGEMFTTGCQAETEMLFIALVSASLLLWHWGEARGWPEATTWIVCYVFVGLAVLTKGPQPPIYFLASVGAYLLCTGQWRRLVRWPHLIGCAAGASLVVGWLALCGLQEGWQMVWAIVMNDTTTRMEGWKLGEVVRHLGQFPLEVLGCTLPWSPLLFVYLSKDFRRSLGRAGSHALFMGLCVGIAFPTCWIPPEGATRYFCPLYPCMAALIGIVVERFATVNVPAILLKAWRWYAQFLSFAMIAAGALVATAAFALASSARHQHFAERPFVALGYFAAVAILAVLSLRAGSAGDAGRVRTVVLSIACFMVLTLTGIATNVRIRRSEDPATPFARLKEAFPSEQRLVSFGHVDALFTYYFEKPIESVAVPARSADLNDAWFCVRSHGDYLPNLPFAWETVAIIPIERSRKETPGRTVVVGRPLPEPRPHVALSSPRP